MSWPDVRRDWISDADAVRRLGDAIFTMVIGRANRLDCRREVARECCYVLSRCSCVTKTSRDPGADLYASDSRPLLREGTVMKRFDFLSHSSLRLIVRLLKFHNTALEILLLAEF